MNCLLAPNQLPSYTTAFDTRMVLPIISVGRDRSLEICWKYELIFM